jgi:DUF4097 and DUF4098 domain-containing protein YvlB
MHHPHPVKGLILSAALLFVATPAFAQRFAFERTLTVNDGASLDVTTNRGKITVTPGTEGRVVVRGTVTVRIGMDVPQNAPALAKALADHPDTIQQTDKTVRIHPPQEEEVRRAVTVAYEIQVPAKMTVLASSDSGAIRVSGIRGELSVTTTSGAIDLSQLGGETEIDTGSGSVTLDGASGAVRVHTQSSAIELRGLGAGLDARTQSGSLSAAFAGAGDVNVETGSSEISLNGVNGGVTSKTGSGRTTIRGAAVRPWTISSSSGGIRLDLHATSGATIDATTRSGSIDADGVTIAGSTEKRRIAGIVGTGGPLIRATSRSGSIRIARIDLEP